MISLACWPCVRRPDGEPAVGADRLRRPLTFTLNLMKVPALRIEVNGELVAVAGAPDLSMLSGQVAFAASGPNRVIDTASIMFNVMGLALSGPQPRQLTWANGLELKVGDRVTFEFVEVSDPTPPGKVLATPSSSELAREAAKQKKVGSQ